MDRKSAGRNSQYMRHASTHTPEKMKRNVVTQMSTRLYLIHVHITHVTILWYVFKRTPNDDASRIIIIYNIVYVPPENACNSSFVQSGPSLAPSLSSRSRVTQYVSHAEIHSWSPTTLDRI